MSSDVKTRIRADLVEARKSRDKERTLVLSTVLSDLKNKEIEVGAPLDDDGAIQVVARAIKQRKDAADQMRVAGRDELADKESFQAELLSAYLPAGLGEEEVRAMVREIISDGVDQIGPLMGRLMPRIRGRFDGREANRIVREELAR